MIYKNKKKREERDPFLSSLPRFLAPPPPPTHTHLLYLYQLAWNSLRTPSIPHGSLVTGHTPFSRTNEWRHG